MTACLIYLYLITTQNIEQLEQIILESEKSKKYNSICINEIFRIMHTIKGSAAMMMFGNISSIAHSAEDLFIL
jgi:two-component system chemotaxis sensor kinase CheA